MPKSTPSKVKIIKRVCVGCLVVTQKGQILLQQRDSDCITFPGCLATFGGGIETNETPLQALVRELKEELGASVQASDAVELGMLTEAESNHSELLYAYYWQDKVGTISGCYEGSPRYYNSPEEVRSHPKLMSDVEWMLQECVKRKLLS